MSISVAIDTMHQSHVKCLRLASKRDEELESGGVAVACSQSNRRVAPPEKQLERYEIDVPGIGMALRRN